jgi:hypothetical protein
VSWTNYTWGGLDGWLWSGQIFIPKNYDPSTGGAAIFLAPSQGRASIPPPAQGDPGVPANAPRNVITNEVAPSVSLPAPTVTIVTPASGSTPAVWDLTFSVHRGNDGSAAAHSLVGSNTPTDLVGTPLAGYEPLYVADTGLALGGSASGIPGVIWTAPKVGGVYWPATIASTTSADGDPRTLCNSTAIPAYPFAWRPRVSGQTVTTGTGTDVRVDLIARVNNATSGDIVGRGFGQAGQTPPTLVLVSGPPAGSASSFGRIAANAGPTTIYLRAERQSGANSFSTSAATTSFQVEVIPLP